jgi:hypothetical protein
MILTLFWALFIISITLIALGVIYSKQWAGVAIIGFTFLFLISMIILSGNLEVEKGSNVSSSYTYGVNGTITDTKQVIEYQYNKWADSTSHTIGYSMAIISAVGTFATIINLRGNWRSNK